MEELDVSFRPAIQQHFYRQMQGCPCIMALACRPTKGYCRGSVTSRMKKGGRINRGKHLGTLNSRGLPAGSG
eukprot:7737150-Pyramimonas_sp.AAC.1